MQGLVRLAVTMRFYVLKGLSAKKGQMAGAIFRLAWDPHPAVLMPLR